MSGSSNKGWWSYRLRERVADGPVVGALGGHPRGLRGSSWPRCAVCGAAMCHMGQIDAGPWLDLGGFFRMSLFICHATGGRCRDWDPWKGANRVVLHRSRDDSMYDGPPTVRVYRRRVLTVDDPLDEKELFERAKRAGRPTSWVLEQLKHDKLGGGAVWLQGDATVKRPNAPGSMRLVAQLTTQIVSFDITDAGMVYVFLDPGDRTERAGRMLWQTTG